MSTYAAKRLATITDPPPITPSLAWPIGTRLALDTEGPWSLIEVAGMFDNGPDSGSYEPIIRPVEIVTGHDCSPRKVSPEAVVALGYEVVTAAPKADEWESAPVEVAAPFDTEANA